MNSIQTLAALVNTLEKLHEMPRDEVLLNENMVAEMRKAMSAPSVVNVINGIIRDYETEKSLQREAIPAASETALIHAYAQREHNRLRNMKDSDAKPYITQIVNAADFTNSQAKELPKPTRKADKDFSSVFNSIYSNGAVKINTPQDPSTLMSYIDYSPYRVNYTEYLSVPTLAEMVDRPIAMALKKPFKVKSDNEEFKAALEDKFKHVKLQSVIKDMLFNSTLSPRGSLLVPIQRNKEITFNVFNDTQFAYGMGSSYSGITAPYNQTRVGDIYCFGAKLKHGVSAFFLCPGYEPLFGVGLNRVPQLRSAAEAWNLYVHILKILLVRAQVIIRRMDGDIQTDTMLSAVRAQLQRLSQSMGISTPLTDPNGQTTDILTNNIAPGTADIAPVLQSFVSSVTGLSPEYLFGGGNATYSQAAFQIHSTNENVRSRFQIGMIEPMARFVVNTLINNDVEIQKFGIAEDDFDIEFDNLYDETEQEKADLQSKRVETLIRMREYSELEKVFKQEGLLNEDVSFAGMKPDHNSDDNPGDGEEGEGGAADSKLIKPLA